MTDPALAPGIVAFGTLANRLRPRTPGPTTLVAVDGWGASGKSTFAARLAAALDDAPVVHTDDIASHDQPTDWWPLLEDWVLGPLAAGRPGRVHRYDWAAGRRTGWIDVPPAPVVLLEGVSAARAAIRDRLACSIWLETADGLRRRRAVERDGPALAAYWDRWRAAERDFYATDPVEPYADVVVDGAPPEVPHPERSFVLLRVRPDAWWAARG